MDKTQHKTGKILPFRQDVDFFLKRGAKELDRNDPLAAIQHYRKAYDSDPADLDSCLALAELLSQMQRFEESNRLLLIDMSMNDPDPESYFGLACNYYGSRNFHMRRKVWKPICIWSRMGFMLTTRPISSIYWRMKRSLPKPLAWMKTKLWKRFPFAGRPSGRRTAGMPSMLQRCLRRIWRSFRRLCVPKISSLSCNTVWEIPSARQS